MTQQTIQAFSCLNSIFLRIDLTMVNVVSLLYVYDLVSEGKRWWRMVFSAISA